MFWRNVMPSDSRARGARIVLVHGDPWRQSKRREPLLSHVASSQKNETPQKSRYYYHLLARNLRFWMVVMWRLPALWDVTPFSLLKIERRFGGTYNFRFSPQTCNLLLHVDIICVVRRSRFQFSTRKQRVAISLDTSWFPRSFQETQWYHFGLGHDRSVSGSLYTNLHIRRLIIW
jgi:hypothetical protein